MTCHALNHACDDRYPCAFAATPSCGGCDGPCPSIACQKVRESEWMRAQERTLA